MLFFNTFAINMFEGIADISDTIFLFFHKLEILFRKHIGNDFEITVKDVNNDKNIEILLSFTISFSNEGYGW